MALTKLLINRGPDSLSPSRLGRRTPERKARLRLRLVKNVKHCKFFLYKKDNKKTKHAHTHKHTFKLISDCHLQCFFFGPFRRRFQTCPLKGHHGWAGRCVACRWSQRLQANPAGCQCCSVSNVRTIKTGKRKHSKGQRLKYPLSDVQKTRRSRRSAPSRGRPRGRPHLRPPGRAADRFFFHIVLLQLT